MHRLYHGLHLARSNVSAAFRACKHSSTGQFPIQKLEASSLCRHGLSSGMIISRGLSTVAEHVQEPVGPAVKYKRLDKTARNIMQIVNREAVEKAREHREIPCVEPGHVIQLRVEFPDNKRRVSLIKGIVIAKRNAGLNTTFRLRRMVAGVGIESLYMLYSPNIKEIKVLEKKKVRRAKLYYLRDRMNALKGK